MAPHYHLAAGGSAVPALLGSESALARPPRSSNDRLARCWPKVKTNGNILYEVCSCVSCWGLGGGLTSFIFMDGDSIKSFGWWQGCGSWAVGRRGQVEASRDPPFTRSPNDMNSKVEQNPALLCMKLEPSGHSQSC